MMRAIILFRQATRQYTLTHYKKAKERVSFAMRVFPLLEMLRAAQKKQVKVMWGVPY